jgi:serine/threonine protein kinase
VKVLAPEIASRGPAWRERFLEEAHLPGKIESRLILETLSVGQDLGMPFFAMPFMKYGSTREMFRSTRPFEPLEATRIARKAAQALADIHAKGFCHGNLKPSNIFMDDNGEFRVADFALPQAPGRPPETGSPVADVLTDIRLLGATYHWLLTGKNPRDVSSRSLSSASRQTIPDLCLRIVENAAPRKAPPVYQTAIELEAALGEAEAAVQGLAPGAQLKRGSGASLGDLMGAPPSGQPRAVEIGQVLGGKYLITELIGQGSSGIVYGARHQTLNIPIAVKMLRLHGDSNVYAQLKTEACLLAQLNHPHIVRVWDFEDDPEMPYLVMEYVEGKSLGQLIKEHGPMRPERAVQVVGQIADGLAAAFQLGIVHRDVKPGNVLLTKDGMIKLADLGLAVFVNGDGGSPVGNGLAGTVAYMPPEQSLSAGVVDHRSDIYALGASFYHLLTGQIPFQGATRMEVILKHAKEPLVPPDELVSGVPQEISQVIVKMMAKSVNDRYQTYDDLLLDLLNLDAGLSQPPGNGNSAAVRPDAGNKSGRFTRSGLFRVPRPG